MEIVSWPCWEQITGKSWDDYTNLDINRRLMLKEEHREQMTELARASLARHVNRMLSIYGATITDSGEISGPSDYVSDILNEEINQFAKNWDYFPILNSYMALSEWNEYNESGRRRITWL